MINKMLVIILIVSSFVFIGCSSSRIERRVERKEMDKITEFNLKEGESKEVSRVTLTLEDAGTKWALDGHSALSVMLKVQKGDEKETLHMSNSSSPDFELTATEWGGIKIFLLGGDNGLANLKVISK